jgi:hypothetical protein
MEMGWITWWCGSHDRGHLYAARDCEWSDDSAAIFKLLLNCDTRMDISSDMAIVDGGLSPETQRRRSESYKLILSNVDWSNVTAVFASEYQDDRSENFYFNGSTPLNIAEDVLHNMWPPWGNKTLAERLEIMTQGTGWRYLGPRPSIVWLFLGSKDLLLASLASCDAVQQRKLAYWSIQMLAEQTARSDEKEADLARDFVRVVLSCTDALANSTYADNDELYAPPMAAYVSTYDYRGYVSRRQDGHFLEAFRCYVREMLLLGMSSASLLEDLRRMLLNRSNLEIVFPWDFAYEWDSAYEWNPAYEWKSAYEEWIRRVVGFTSGPNPDDWSVYLSNPLDEHAGEFWDMIEHPERAMPGAWNDD